MSDQQGPAVGSSATADRGFLPAMGVRALLPLYEPCTRLLGLPRVHRELVAQAGLRPGLRVVEVGCGPGGLLRMVRRRHPDADLAGLDPDPDALRRARRKVGGRGVQLDRGFADALPYADASCDRGLSSFMWHHLDPADKPAALREIARVLRPGGRLHLVDMTGTDPIHRLLSRRTHRHTHTVDRPDELAAALRAAGFVDVAVAERSGVRLGRHAYYRASR